MPYFDNFPLIQYKGKVARNIILNAKIVQDVFNKQDVYYPYLVTQGERPDTVAYKIYGDPFDDWVVYYSNNMKNSFYDWVMEDDAFQKYLRLKYNISDIQTTDILKSQISHYKYFGVFGESEEDIARKSWEMSTFTYSKLTTEEKAGWLPIYVYDGEVERNEAKRKIRLLDPRYLNQIKNELSVIFK